MNVFERVREVNQGRDLTEERIGAARARLLAGIDEGRSAERKRIVRRPMFLIAGAVAGVAAVTATAMIVSQPTSSAPKVETAPIATDEPRVPEPVTPKPTPAPTTGTAVAEPFPGTTPRADQYLQVLTTDDRVMYLGGDGNAQEWLFRPDSQSLASAAIVRSFSRLFVPGDRTGEWVGDYGPRNEKLHFFPQNDESAWNSGLPYESGRDRWTYTGGIGGEILPLTGSDDWYARYPDDPRALLQFLTDRSESFGVPPEGAREEAVSYIIEELSFNYAPATTRAVFLQALELSGSAESVMKNESITTYRFSFGRVANPNTTTVSIDTTTGWATELTKRWERTGDDVGDVVPASVPDIHQTFSVSIVDSVPLP